MVRIGEWYERASFPFAVFLLFTTMATIAGIAVGTVLSVVWFIRMLRRCGLRVRFRHA